MASRDEVMAALVAVPGPDGRTPLPDSGAISGLTIREGKVFVAIVVDPDRAKTMEPMRARAEAAIKATPGVTSAVVTLTAESARAVGGAAPAQAHGEAHQRHAGRGARSTSAHPRRQAHHRGRLRQGRRRQVDGRLQSRGRPRQTRPQDRRARRRPLRPLDAEAVRHRRQAGDDAGRAQARPARGLWRQGDVDRLPRRRGRARDLARADGDVGAKPTSARGRLGRSRRAGRRHAAGHRRHPAHHGAERAALGRGDRLHAAGSGADRRPARHRHVQPGACAAHRRPSRT